ncbi:hypothetical protein B0H13DRAFT_2307797 [Mycena leptocephala]|nr:hypothetical protein B0H13DRAFT_2307797 [Mycena leptocephala]
MPHRPAQTTQQNPPTPPIHNLFFSPPPEFIARRLRSLQVSEEIPPKRQFDNAASFSTIVEHFESRAASILAKLQAPQELLDDTLQNFIAVQNLVIHTNDPASSSFPPPSTPNSTQLIVSVPQLGLATHSTVAPPETCPCALPPPLGTFPEDAIT